MSPIWLLLAVALGDGPRNPHTEQADQPQAESACVLCHTGAPTKEEPALQLPAAQLCASCHTGERHTGIASHLGKTPPKPATDRATAAGLPLPDGAIACVTCHDPHPAEHVAAPIVPLRWWVSVLGGGREPLPTEPALLRLTLRDGALCTGCHDPASPGFPQ